MAIYMWSNPASPHGKSILIRTIGGMTGIAIAEECCCDEDDDNTCQCYGPPIVGQTMYATVTATDCGGCPVDWQMAWNSIESKWMYNNFLCSGAPMVYFVIELDCLAGDCPPPNRSFWLYFSRSNSEPPIDSVSVRVLCEMLSGPPNLLLEATVTIPTPASLCGGSGMTFTVQISDSP